MPRLDPRLESVQHAITSASHLDLDEKIEAGKYLNEIFKLPVYRRSPWERIKLRFRLWKGRPWRF
jgi:hypothetical protein